MFWVWSGDEHKYETTIINWLHIIQVNLNWRSSSWHWWLYSSYLSGVKEQIPWQDTNNINKLSCISESLEHTYTDAQFWSIWKFYLTKFMRLKTSARYYESMLRRKWDRSTSFFHNIKIEQKKEKVKTVGTILRAVLLGHTGTNFDNFHNHFQGIYCEYQRPRLKPNWAILLDHRTKELNFGCCYCEFQRPRLKPNWTILLDHPPMELNFDCCWLGLRNPSMIRVMREQMDPSSSTNLLGYNGCKLSIDDTAWLNWICFDEAFISLIQKIEGSKISEFRAIILMVSPKHSKVFQNQTTIVIHQLVLPSKCVFIIRWSRYVCCLTVPHKTICSCKGMH